MQVREAARRRATVREEIATWAYGMSEWAMTVVVFSVLLFPVGFVLSSSGARGL